MQYPGFRHCRFRPGCQKPSQQYIWKLIHRNACCCCARCAAHGKYTMHFMHKTTSILEYTSVPSIYFLDMLVGDSVLRSPLACARRLRHCSSFWSTCGSSMPVHTRTHAMHISLRSSSLLSSTTRERYHAFTRQTSQHAHTDRRSDFASTRAAHV